MPSPKFIPRELTDAIIRFVTDRKTLLACALVCRNWLPASRHRLFEHIDITCMQYDLFVARVLDSEAMRPWLSSVRYFRLHDHRGFASGEWVPLTAEENGLRRSQYLLHDIIGRLPNLTKLTLWYADWIQRPPHPSVHHILRSPVALPSLRRLELFEHQFPSFSSFRRLLASLPRLEDLYLQCVRWPPAVHDLSSVHAVTSPALVGLEILPDVPEDYCIANVLTWLAHTPSRQSIRELRYYTEWMDRHSAFLQVVAPHLTKLSLEWPLGMRSSPSLPAHDTHATHRLMALFENLYKDVDRYPIAELVNLRELALELFCSKEMPWRDVASLLQILPARLHDLEIRVYARIEGEIPVGIEDDGLELLEPILAKAQFAELTSVEIYVSGRYPDRPEISFAPPEIKIAEIVRQKLPKLHARGVISICVDLDPYDESDKDTANTANKDSGISNDGGPALG